MSTLRASSSSHETLMRLTRVGDVLLGLIPWLELITTDERRVHVLRHLLKGDLFDALVWRKRVKLNVTDFGERIYPLRGEVVRSALEMLLDILSRNKDGRLRNEAIDWVTPLTNRYGHPEDIGVRVAALEFLQDLGVPARSPLTEAVNGLVFAAPYETPGAMRVLYEVSMGIAPGRLRAQRLLELLAQEAAFTDSVEKVRLNAVEAQIFRLFKLLFEGSFQRRSKGQAAIVVLFSITQFRALVRTVLGPFLDPSDQGYFASFHAGVQQSLLSLAAEAARIDCQGISCEQATEHFICHHGQTRYVEFVLGATCD